VTHDDHLQQLLAGQPDLTQLQRATIYDHFWTDTPVTFAKFLHGFIGLPEKLIGELIATRISVPWQEPKEKTPEDKVIQAINLLKTVDPRVLEVCERHGQISKAIISAVMGSKE
jgi:hypothetical protein